MNTMKPINKWQATMTRRWHTNIRLRDTHDDTGGHSARVALIITHYWLKCRKELLMAALTHDMAEIATGDVPGPAKRANPALEAAHNAAEAEWNAQNGIDHARKLGLGEQRMLAFADRLDAYMWAEQHGCNMKRDGWLECSEWLGAEAADMELDLEGWFA
tara:strand:- start:85 stop:564 length:480 start_codon:yes stop_codon:yes gene_type:complete